MLKYFIGSIIFFGVNLNYLYSQKSIINKYDTIAVNNNKVKVTFEWVSSLNPTDINIKSGSFGFKLNGKSLYLGTLPQFYLLQINQIPFLQNIKNINELFDIPNAYFFTFRFPKLEAKYKLFKDSKLIIGDTHDKIQTYSQSVQFHYPNGNFNLTILFDKNIYKHSSILYSQFGGLIYRFSYQIGLLIPLRKIDTNIDTVINSNHYKIESINHAATRELCLLDTWPFKSGYGGITGFNVEAGGRILKWLYYTIGFRLSYEVLKLSDKVIVNNSYDAKLTNTINAVFIAGPNISLKFGNYNH